jgi:hypothetical protein
MFLLINFFYLSNKLKNSQTLIEYVEQKLNCNFFFIIELKVHKIENFFGFDFEICTFS